MKNIFDLAKKEITKEDKIKRKKKKYLKKNYKT